MLMDRRVENLGLNKDNWRHVDFDLKFRGTWRLTIRCEEATDDQLIWELGQAMRVAKVPRVVNVLGHHGHWILEQVKDFFKRPEVQAEVERRKQEWDRKTLRENIDTALEKMKHLAFEAMGQGATEEEIFNAVRQAGVKHVMES